MATQMFRYVVPIDDRAHEFDLDHTPVAVEAREESVTPQGRARYVVDFWCEHDDGDHPRARRAFQVFGTGHEIPAGARWVGTCPRTDGLVWHLYEMPPAARR